MRSNFEVWPGEAALVTGRISSPTEAGRISYRLFQSLSLRYGLQRGMGVVTAGENLILQLEPGEVARAACTARVQGHGVALLIVTDRRLLGDGEGDWRLAAPWTALDGAWPRHDRTDLRGHPGHQLVVGGVAIDLDGPFGYREAVVANAWRGVLEDALDDLPRQHRTP